ncbi:hypothetical protein CW731_10475 [Polaribacter sp. ALD11]|uniref:DUF6973 domain-containing protein n=1 Tax=Polaribacter sp. ALD11 TaxID=2058137 RepID=UPI000C31B43F|nr:hypothetical protein [Polaribacter sp. ALD11]AUC85684.1 hypothetical protein CW731_10475 [Polaribacter sp. ALD11]
MRKTLILIFFSFSISVSGQSDFKNFLKLSGPIKRWVLLHPFKAKLSLKISNETNSVADSVRKSHLLDKDAAGGQVDAFRHAYWMARLRQEIGKRAARSLGKAHEKDNYLTYKKLKLEDGVVPDEISSEMDLHNNDEGLKLITKGSEVSKNGLIYRVINAIHQGKMKIIKKNEKGNFLTCEGKIISAKKLKGKWKNEKCLVSSNQSMK